MLILKRPLTSQPETVENVDVRKGLERLVGLVKMAQDLVKMAQETVV
jgi:hypothetical protein